MAFFVSVAELEPVTYEVCGDWSHYLQWLDRGVPPLSSLDPGDPPPTWADGIHSVRKIGKQRMTDLGRPSVRQFSLLEKAISRRGSAGPEVDRRFARSRVCSRSPFCSPPTSERCARNARTIYWTLQLVHHVEPEIGGKLAGSPNIDKNAIVFRTRRDAVCGESSFLAPLGLPPRPVGSRNWRATGVRSGRAAGRTPERRKSRMA